MTTLSIVGLAVVVIICATEIIKCSIDRANDRDDEDWYRANENFFR